MNEYPYETQCQKTCSQCRELQMQTQILLDDILLELDECPPNWYLLRSRLLEIIDEKYSEVTGC